MAHIAACLANSEPAFMASSKPASPVPSQSIRNHNTHSPRTMTPDQQQQQQHQQQPQPRYQLFPREKQLPPIHPERSYSPALSAKSSDGGLRTRLNQHNLIRRRKISVPELGPMTTVQEIAMDSPTIPGRPALHERSNSAPEGGRNAKALEPRHRLYMDNVDALSRAVDEAFELSDSSDAAAAAMDSTTSKSLPPLMIPIPCASSSPRLQSKHSFSQLRYGTSPPLDTIRSAKPEASSASPRSYGYGRFTPELPGAPILTPTSAPLMDSYRASPQAWEAPMMPAARSESGGFGFGHRRGASDTTGIMDRGRPRKRGESRSNGSPLLNRQEFEEAAPKTAERKAFEELPSGIKPTEALTLMDLADIETLCRQATSQAERFEVLKLSDVEALSKELRLLDERTEYLRRTYTSLRAGRRNLHSRICQYLRATRVARFSHEAMLKQEDALAELDASIDEWFNKLEQAENRRTRVRQKLLEHVAAAAILPAAAANPNPTPRTVCTNKDLSLPVQGMATPPRSPVRRGGSVSPDLCSRSTPETEVFGSRTGGNVSPSPHRVVPQVPSTILEHPVIEESPQETEADRVASTLSLARSDAESIRIYAGDDLLSLLTDVENEIYRLSRSAETLSPPMRSDSQIIRHERQISHEKLNGNPAYSPIHIPSLKTAPLSKKQQQLATSLPEQFKIEEVAEEEEEEEQLIFLTSAVFKP